MICRICYVILGVVSLQYVKYCTQIETVEPKWIYVEYMLEYHVSICITPISVFFFYERTRILCSRTLWPWPLTNGPLYKHKYNKQTNKIYMTLQMGSIVLPKNFRFRNLLTLSSILSNRILLCLIIVSVYCVCECNYNDVWTV